MAPVYPAINTLGGVAQGRLQVAGEEGCVKSCAEVTTLGRVQLVGVEGGV